MQSILGLGSGTAGLIGSHVALELLNDGFKVIGFDDLNDYYDVSLKRARLARFDNGPGYIHINASPADREAVALYQGAGKGTWQDGQDEDVPYVA